MIWICHVTQWADVAAITCFYLKLSVTLSVVHYLWCCQPIFVLLRYCWARDDVLQLSGVQCVAEVLLHHSHYTQALLRADIAGHPMGLSGCVCVCDPIASRHWLDTTWEMFCVVLCNCMPKELRINYALLTICADINYLSLHFTGCKTNARQGLLSILWGMTACCLSASAVLH